MKRRFLALTLALVMVVGLLPVLGVSADDQVDNRLDLSLAKAATAYAGGVPNYYKASAEGVEFKVTEQYTATLSGNMARSNEAAGVAALYYTGLFPSTTNLDEHVTQTITITDMPIFSNPNYTSASTATGYYNVLTRNYGNPTETTVGSGTMGMDYLMYTIYRKNSGDDVNDALGLAVVRPGGGGAIIEVPLFAEKLGEEFTLTTVWNVNNTVSFYCDGKDLGTFDNVTYYGTDRAALGKMLCIGYGSYPDDNNGGYVNLTVSDVKVSHGHTPVADDGNCTSEVTCSDCGAVTTPAKIAHSFDRKVPAEAYKKADGEYYLSCACGTSSEDTEQEATFTVFDLSLAKAATAYAGGVPNYHVASSEGVEFDATGKYTATLSGSMTNTQTNKAVLYFTGVFPSTTNLYEHVTQTVTINEMPIFTNPTFTSTNSASAYYNLLTRNYGNPSQKVIGGGQGNGMDYLMYSIYRKNDDGDLGLRIVQYGGTNIDVPKFAEKLKIEFTLTTVWNADSSVTFYCDGEDLGTFENVIYWGTDAAKFGKMLSIGYGAGYADTDNANVNLSVSNVVISNGHTAAADDGDCTTDILCTDCGAVMTEGCEEHVSAADDDNCTTPVICGTEGCNYVVTPAHTLEHREQQPATATATGTLEHWYCAICEKAYSDANGTSVLEDLTIPMLDIGVTEDKAQVSEGYVSSAINGAGTNVELEVKDETYPVSKVELPAASLDALANQDKDLVITTDKAVITLNHAAIAAINDDAGENALSIEVKAGASLSETQNTAVSAVENFSALKGVISAEMFAGETAIWTADNAGGAVIIKVPFTLEADAGLYKLYYVPAEGAPVEIAAEFDGEYMTATLDHFSEYAIVLTEESGDEPIVGNGTITSNNGSATATVTGTYVDGIASGDVFSVNVTWDGLSFNYMAANSWDAENHTYTGGGWEDVTGNVKVVNHSNIAVNVVVTKEDVLGEKNLGVDFVGASTDVLDAGTTENVENPDEFTVEFKPRGTLVEGDEDVTLATITVTITKYVPQN